MSPIPPPPDGFKPDPLGTINGWGVTVTNGFRTPADTERLKRQGYHPADNSLHLDGDAVDIVPGKSGLSMDQLHHRAQALASTWKGAKVLNEGDHIHVQLPGWGGAPGMPAPPAGFQPVTAQPSPHDGDTVKLSNGQNGRLLGADAFELNQQGRGPDNRLIPLGVQARDFMAARVPGLPATFTGGQSFGRPIVSLGTNGNDPAQALLRNGYGMAEPQYLRGSDKFMPYMDAERLARLNQLGGFGTNAETPSQFRHKNGPWQGAEPGTYGQNGQAVFWDEPTPFQGLRPEIAKGYISLWQDPKSTPDDLLAYAKANGFDLNEKVVRDSYRRRNAGAKPGSEVVYGTPPEPMTDPGDGALGAAGRGFADPVNMIDELGGVADALGVPDFGGPRENIWNSDRRFGDILWNNIDQNRAILSHDEQYHPYARTGGQLASGLAIPGLGVEGVGARATEQALASGASRWAAEQAARKAVAQRLAGIGAAEGGAMGFGAGEGGPIQRLPEAAVGAATGAVAAPLLGEAINAGSNLARRGISRLRGSTALGDGVVASPAASTAPVGARPYVDPDMIQRVNGGYALPRGAEAAAMAADDDAPSIASHIVESELPPPPSGFTPVEGFPSTKAMNERLSAEEMAKLAEGVDPRSVTPREPSAVETLGEAQIANPSRFQELPAPDEFQQLGVRNIPTASGRKTKLRGPLDMTQTLRTMGGLKDDGGTLSWMGLSNAPRKMNFGSNEQFLGKLIDNEKGMPLDIAAHRLWEDGFFPGHSEAPTADELLTALRNESMGQRYFRPDDQPELDAFAQARSERARIDAAAEEGAPLVKDVSESISLDDLVNNTPPVSAYEETPKLTSSVGNINLANIEKSRDVAQLISQVANRVGGFSAASRGRITHEETAALASELGIKPEQLLRRQQGQALNAEQLFATRNLVQKSREVVVGLAQKAIGGSDDDLARFRSAWLRHVALEEHASAATAEAGRALSQMRMLAKGSNANSDAVRAYLKAGGGRENIEDAARAIVDLSADPARANYFMRQAVKPRWRDKFNELWINGLLSGPTTHAVNMVGNGLTTALSFPETALAAGIGKITRSADRAYFREVGARAAGLADSSLDAIKAARKAFSTGEASDEVTKVEEARPHAIGGRAGEVIRIPTKALTAADEFWSGLLRGAELRQIAYRKAAEEATSAADLRARYAALRAAPTDEMLKEASNAAKYYTFRKELGPVGRAIQQISNNWIGGKLVIPFVRTPINILKFAGERSVFAPAMPEVRAAIKAGGRSRDEALAKITLGSGLSTAAVVAAMNGRISGGGPTDPQERAALLQSGWQPYSIRIGDRWVSYSRFDPVSTLFGVAADFAEAGKWATKKEADQIALNLSASIAKNITNKTWLSGLSDAFDVLSDPERYGKNYFQRLAGSVVPSLSNQIEQATDPYMRDARTLMDGIKARVPYVASHGIPGVTAPVSVRRDIWGEPIERGNAVGPDIVSPFYATKASSDPVKVEVARLRAPLSMPERSIMVQGKRVPLTAQQYDDLVQMTGHAAKAYLDGYIRSKEWRAMTDDERRDSVQDAFKEFRATARDELRQRYPSLAINSPPSPQTKPVGGHRRGGPLPPPPSGFVRVGQP